MPKRFGQVMASSGLSSSDPTKPKATRCTDTYDPALEASCTQLPTRRESEQDTHMSHSKRGPSPISEPHEERSSEPCSINERAPTDEDSRNPFPVPSGQGRWSEWELYELDKAVKLCKNSTTKEIALSYQRVLNRENIVVRRSIMAICDKIRKKYGSQAERWTKEDGPDEPCKQGTTTHDVDYELLYGKLTKSIKKHFHDSNNKSSWRKKVPKSRGNKDVIKAANEFIAAAIEVEDDMSLDRLNRLVYATSKAVAELCIKPREPTEWEVTHTKSCENNRVKREKVDLLIRCSANGKTLSKAEVKNLDADARKFYDSLKHHKDQEKRTWSLASWKNYLTLRSKELDDMTKMHIRQKTRPINRNKSARIMFSQRQKRDVKLDQKRVVSIRYYWSKIVGVKVDTKLSNPMRGFSERPCTNEPLDVNEYYIHWRAALKKSKAFKAPGPDGIYAYWWKVLSPASDRLFNILREFIEGEKYPPTWMCQGRVVLLHKKGDENDPGNFRPISCLNTCYKLMTGVQTNFLLKWCRQNKILADEQRALRKGEWATLVCHTIDKLMKYTLSKRKEKYCVIWVDCKKAYDSISHSYLDSVLKKIGIPKWLYHGIKNVMKQWSVRYSLGRAISKPLKVQRGVLQGDVLSPLLFCLGLVPVSYALRTDPEGIPVIKLEGSKENEVTSGALNHLFYMDDLIAYCKVCLRKLALTKIREYLGAVGLETNDNKSATLTKGKVGDNEVPELGLDDTYKYLGLEDAWVTDTERTLDNKKKSIEDALSKVWLSDWSARKKAGEHNSMIVPKIGYIYATAVTAKNAYNVSLKRAHDVDKMLPSILKKNHIMNHTACSERLFLPRNMGGLGVRSVSDTLEIETLRKAVYLRFSACFENACRLMETMNRNQHRCAFSDYEKVADKYDLNIEVIREQTITINNASYTSLNEANRIISEVVLTKAAGVRFTRWATKPTGGRIFKYNFDRVLSWKWLETDINLNSVLTAFAVQENAISGLLNHPMHDVGDKTCRVCRELDIPGPELEDATHVVSRCPCKMSNIYLQRHNNAVRVLANSILRSYGMKTIHFNEGVSGVICSDDGKVTIWLDAPCTKLVKTNKPDIVVEDSRDEATKSAWIIEIGITWPKSLVPLMLYKEAKYGINGAITYREVERCANRSEIPIGTNLAGHYGNKNFLTKVIPVVIGTQGEVLEQTLQNIRKCPIGDVDAGKILQNMQRAAVLGTAHAIRAQLAVKNV